MELFICISIKLKHEFMLHLWLWSRITGLILISLLANILSSFVLIGGQHPATLFAHLFIPKLHVQQSYFGLVPLWEAVLPIRRGCLSISICFSLLCSFLGKYHYWTLLHWHFSLNPLQGKHSSFSMKLSYLHKTVSHSVTVIIPSSYPLRVLMIFKLAYIRFTVNGKKYSGLL